MGYCEGAPILRLERGEFSIEHWPAELRVPFGLRRRGDRLIGPARMRARGRLTLQDAGVLFVDKTGIRPGAGGLDEPSDPFGGGVLLTALALADNRGLVQGLAEERRYELVDELVRGWRRNGLVLTRDSAASIRWRERMAAAGLARAVVVESIGTRDVMAAVRAFDLLVVDGVEHVPRTRLLAVLDGSPALGRLGFLDRLDTRLAEQLAPGLGSVLHCSERVMERAHRELRVPLPDDVREAYDKAWHTFFSAFDRFSYRRPDAGFGAFIAEARREPGWRPALTAWHRANQIAGWHENKLELIGDLASEYGDRRLLVFTPTRQAAYDLAQAFLLPAVTAEIPLHERRDLIAGFAAGDYPALVGPRLLDLGVSEGAADVAIVAGGTAGASQRGARASRVRSGGEIVQLASLDTVEVGRAQRWRTDDRAAPDTVDAG